MIILKGNLVIIVKNNSFDIIYALSNIPIASSNRKYKNISELKQHLTSFVLKNNLRTKWIKNIILVTDLTDLRTHKNEHNLGYIKIGYMQKDKVKTKRLLNNKALNIYDFNIQSMQCEKNKDELIKYLIMLKTKGIEKIAINSDFSTLDSNKEKELIDYINKIYPNTFTIKASYTYNVFNFILRENMLFLDLMLHETAHKFTESINHIFHDLGIDAPVYYMKGNGKLMSSKLALTCPIFTWQSIFSSTLIGSSINTGERNAFILIPYDNGIKMGIVQNSLPKLDDTFSYFQGLQVSNSYPRYTFFKSLPSNIKWNKFTKQINLFNGPAPIINLLKEQNPHYFFNHKLINLEEHSTIVAKGALNSTYELELTSTMPTSNSKIIKMEKNELILEANRILKNNNINLKSIRYDFKLIPIKYMPKNSIFLKLFITGKIN